jgi:type II secretion system protein H
LEGHRIGLKASRPSARRAGGGFTLLELLVVLILIGLAAGFAAPRWLASLPGVQLASGARKTAALLRHAGDRAVSEQTLQRVIVDLANHTLELSRLESDDSLLPPEDPALEGAASPPVVLPLPEEVFVESAENGLGQPQFDRLGVFFFPSGGNTGARLTLTNTRGRRLVVQLDFITGQVKIHSIGKA